MTPWKTLLNTQCTELQTQNYICDTSTLGLILVTGEDAESFLQNQLSNDIRQLDEQHFHFSACSTPKGRMLGIFRVIQITNGYILIMPLSLVASVLNHLQHYVIGSQVSLADASAHFFRFAIQTDITEITSSSLLATQSGEAVQSDSLIALNLGLLDGQSRHLILSLSEEEALSVWQTFAQKLHTSTAAAWRLSEIKAGIPVIYPQTVAEFVAQMSNLDQLGGINFKKGCYPGQEIIARMQYLGKLKRRMFLAQIETDTPPSPGDALVSLDVTTADGSGKVVDAAMDHEGRCFCLYIAHIQKATSNHLQLLKQPEARLTLLALPYE